jgi:DNA repair protein RadC
MKHHLRTIEWKFREVTQEYPEVHSSERIYIRSPDDIIQHFRFLFEAQVRERFVVVWLNSANRVTGYEVVSEGTLNASIVHPREVFRGSIVATCAAIVVAHNHPSGNPEPSREDVEITRQLVEAGKIIGIPVHDHIIFAGDKHTSFAERGLM